jgi:hypothetical protein
LTYFLEGWEYTGDDGEYQRVPAVENQQQEPTLIGRFLLPQPDKPYLEASGVSQALQVPLHRYIRRFI